ncbi:MAG: cytochrome c [Nitrospinae bacterium]|nr:cytochrome c [Nitrospinota bacterium]
MKKASLIKMAAFLAASFAIQLSGAKAALAETAEANYALYCVQCHGSAGTGKGINAPYLAVAPRNHTSDKDMSSLTDDGIALAIKEGGAAVSKSTQMPAWKSVLTDAEIKDLVAHLRKMCKCSFKKP